MFLLMDVKYNMKEVRDKQKYPVTRVQKRRLVLFQISSNVKLIEIDFTIRRTANQV